MNPLLNDENDKEIAGELGLEGLLASQEEQLSPFGPFGGDSLSKGLFNTLGDLVAPPGFNDPTAPADMDPAQPQAQPQAKPDQTPDAIELGKKAVDDAIKIMQATATPKDAVLWAAEKANPGSQDLTKFDNPKWVEIIKARRLILKSAEEYRLTMPHFSLESLAKAFDEAAAAKRANVPQKKIASMKDMSDSQRRVSLGMMLGALLSGRGGDTAQIAGNAYKLQQEVNDTQYANELARQKAEDEARELSLKAAGFRSQDLKALYEGDWAAWKTKLDMMTAGQADLDKLIDSEIGATQEFAKNYAAKELGKIGTTNPRLKGWFATFDALQKKDDTKSAVSTRRATAKNIAKAARAAAEEPGVSSIDATMMRQLANEAESWAASLPPNIFEDRITAEIASRKATDVLKGFQAQLAEKDVKSYGIRLQSELATKRAVIANYAAGVRNMQSLMTQRSRVGDLESKKFEWAQISGRMGDFFKGAQMEQTELLARRGDLVKSINGIQNNLFGFMEGNGPEAKRAREVTLPALKQEMADIDARLKTLKTAVDSKTKNMSIDAAADMIKEVAAGATTMFDENEEGVGQIADELEGMLRAQTDVGVVNSGAMFNPWGFVAPPKP